MIHIDLFADIGGNSYAFDKVFHETKNTHIFCEIEPYCQAVLRKHWPDAYIHSDIRSFAYPTIGRSERRAVANERKQNKESTHSDRPFILTGGFPCQPFSQAGRRKGTEDDRYLWPAMFGVIRNLKPQWVIASEYAKCGYKKIKRP